MRTTRLEKARGDAARAKLRIGQHALQQRAVGLDAGDLELGQRPVQRIDRLRARLAPRDELAEHGIVERRHLIARIDTDIEPQSAARLARPAQMRDAADARQILVRGILGVEARLDGGTLRHDRRCAARQVSAAGDLELPLHQIDAGDELGDRMLDLQARVHFHEVELLRGVHQELDRAGTDIADGARGGEAACAMAARTSARSPGAGASSMIF